MPDIYLAWTVKTAALTEGGDGRVGHSCHAWSKANWSRLKEIGWKNW
jgi:hypothetical protein